MEKRKKAGKYAKKVKAKTRRKMHEQSNPLEPDEFADMWKEEWLKRDGGLTKEQLLYTIKQNFGEAFLLFFGFFPAF